MQITLYRRSYPVPGAPVAWSFVPHSPGQRHTFTAGGKVYEADRGEVQIIVPDGAKLDVLRDVLSWAGDKGPIKSTAKEVYALAESGTSGFKLVK